jgi:hypothetical protein
LGFPAKLAESGRACGEVGYHVRSTSDLRVKRLLSRSDIEEKLIGHSVDKPEAKERRSSPMCNDRGLFGDDFALKIDSIEFADAAILQQRAAKLNHGVEGPIHNPADSGDCSLASPTDPFGSVTFDT